MVTRAKFISGKPYGRVCAKKIKAAVLPAQERIAQLEQDVADLKGVIKQLLDKKSDEIKWDNLPTVPSGGPVATGVPNGDYAKCISELKDVLAARGILN